MIYHTVSRIPVYHIERLIEGEPIKSVKLSIIFEINLVFAKTHSASLHFHHS